MISLRLSLMILFILTGLFIGQALFYFNGLPDQIASHFDGAGRPDAWMTKHGFFLFEFFLISVLLIQFLGVPWLVARLPQRWINLPNRDYWFSEDRRNETLKSIKVFFEWFSVMLLAMFIAVNQLVFEANMSGRGLWSTGIWTILFAYLLAAGFWILFFLRRFRLPG